MEKKTIIANWKMNGSGVLMRELTLAAERTANSLPEHISLVLCPPAVYLQEMTHMLRNSPVAIGGQNCHAELSGAFTGDISAPMLSDVGAKYVILGHSERRQQHGETNEQVRAKAEAALKSSLISVICVGESLVDRESGKAVDVVTEQVRASIPSLKSLTPDSHFLLAYEPIWAIGSGQIPSEAEIVSMHAAISDTLFALTGKQVPVIYGGSVTPENAHAILHLSKVCGVLVGGASLKVESFAAIANAAI